MSKVEIDPVIRRRLRPQWHTRNGQLVSAQFQADLAGLVNQIARYRTPQWFRGGGNIAANEHGDPGIVADKLYRFAGWITPMAGTMVARVLMAQSSQSSQTNNPYVSLTLYDTSGNVISGGTVASKRAHFGYGFGATPQDVPNEFGVASIGIDVSAYRDTAFRAVLQAHEEARIISCTVYEVALPPDTDNGYVPQTYSVGQPILDEDRSAIQDLAVRIYKRGCGPLLAHSSETDASALTSALTYSGNFYVNIGRDPFAEKPNTTEQYFRLDTRYMNRKTTTTIPVRFWCVAGMAAGTGAIRFVDTAGNVYATFSITGGNGGAPTWQTEITGNLPADLRDYAIEHISDGVNPLTTYGFGVHRWMA